MFTVTSIDAADIDPHRLSAVMSDYVALEEARTYRHLFCTRFGGLAILFAIAGLGLHWMPVIAAWGSVAVCLAVIACAWVAELRCDWKLAKALEGLPTVTVPSAVSPPNKVIRKS